MTTAGATSQAILSASLTGIMNAAEIGSVPVEVVGGRHLRFGVEGAQQEPLTPLVRSERANLCVESIPGYWESATEGVFAQNVQVHRDWLEAGDFFKDWKGLQEQTNWVTALGRSALATAAQRTSSPFVLALLYEGMDNRGMALEKYVEAASDHNEREEHTLAAMVWEGALAILGPSERYQYEGAFRREAALSFLGSLGDFEIPYDPHRLRLARGLWHAYECDRTDVYIALLMKWAEYNEKRSAPIDAGSNELRTAEAILRGKSLDAKDLTAVSEMIRSAATIFSGANHFRINIETLLRLAVETAALAAA